MIDKIIIPQRAVLRQTATNKVGDTFVLCEYLGNYVTWLCAIGGTVYGNYFDTYQEAIDDLKIRSL